MTKYNYRFTHKGLFYICESLIVIVMYSTLQVGCQKKTDSVHLVVL